MKKGPLITVAIVIVVVGLFLIVGKDKKTANTQSATTNTTTTNKDDTKTNASSSDNEAVPTNAVNIANMAFSPGAITVPLGATVHWNNSDSMAHTVTADDGSFESGSIETNKSFTHSFTTAGTYKYHCSFHSSMTGTVIVRSE